MLADVRLAAAYLRACDGATGPRGGRRNVDKTIVTVCASADTLAAQDSHWGLAELRQLATVLAYGETDKQKQLGVAMGGAARRCNGLLPSHAVKSLRRRRRAS